MPKCRLCETDKPLNDFSKLSTSKTGYRNYCKECNVERVRNWERLNPKKAWASDTLKKHRARGHNIIITTKELYSKIKHITNCEICGDELDWRLRCGKGTLDQYSPTLDRINNEKDIKLDNIFILCHRCNMSKGVMPFNTFIEYCSKIAEKYQAVYTVSSGETP